ncbi:zinc-dependent metalloprotease [Crossiella sp. SN42]|uniref:zinc-dependent metalloprotease n=1 Tax=Crossiella sp. SN42 TaxID=2944808 RepID=UPI00207D0224|nr:zinc-dependent metalloprotease [Crossiella sp. SN42]MCO1578965.1 zinc-dependent metalloprotease [Crossiella sp. SN42]
MNAGSAARPLDPAEGPGPVDWGVATATAHRLLRPGPVIARDAAQAAVRGMRELSVAAEGHVRQITGLGLELPLLPGEVVDRPAWVRGAVDGLAALTDHALPRGAGGWRGGVLAGTAGVQAGMVLAYLSTRVLGQYDPFGGPDGEGRLLLVAPNIVAAQQALRVPEEDFWMWVCLHESTHRLQFTAVPWLRAHFAAQVGTLLSSMDDATAGLLSRVGEALRSARRKDGEENQVALVELLQSPRQRAVLDRIIALSTLLEGHADHVMDAAGPAVVPSVATIRSRFTVRRNPRGVADRVLRALLGVDAKIRQYAQGSAFTGHVVDRVGMAAFNQVWQSPETLPTRAEIADPDAWIRRVLG